MPAADPIQTSFAAGEISPRLRGRVDAPVYKQGLASCLNFNPTPQGSLLKAEGLHLVARPAETNSSFIRGLTFKGADLSRYQVVLSDRKIRIYTPAGVLEATAPEKIINPGCDAGGGGWLFSAPESGGRYVGYRGPIPDQFIAFDHSSPAAWARQPPVVALAAGNYRLSWRLRNGADYLTGTTVTRVIPNLNGRAGTTLGGSELGVTYGHGAGEYELNFTLAAPTTVYVQFDTNTSSQTGLDDISLRSTGSVGYLDAPWWTEEIPQVQFVCETGRDRMILVHPFYEPQVLVRASDGIWSLLGMFTDAGGVAPTIAPVHTVPEWSGAGSPDRDAVGVYRGEVGFNSGTVGDGNWPAVVEIWQGRVWLAGTPSKRNTFWASRPFSYNFTADNYAALAAGDGFSYDAAVKGEIRWLQGQKVMLCGTDDGEFSFSANDGVVYAGNLEIRQESAFGSAKMQALSVGDQVLFVSPDRKKLRAMSFSLEGGGWYSRDITFAADHITNPTIKDIAFARDPFSTIVLCLGNGTLACCNYNRADSIAGWWRREFSGAPARSVSVMSRPEGDEVWALVDVVAATEAKEADQIFVARWPLFETDHPKFDLGRSAAPSRAVPTNGTLALDSSTLVLTASSAIFARYFVCPGTRIRIGGDHPTIPMGIVSGGVEVVSIIDTTHALVKLDPNTEGDLSAGVLATSDWNYLTAIVTIAPGFGAEGYQYPITGATARLVVRNEETGELQFKRTWPGNVETVTYSVPTDGYAVAVDEWAQDELLPPVESTYSVGLEFVAEAETLPLEGGNPAGTSQGMNIHRAEISVRLNDSGLPLLNGAIAAPSENRFFAIRADPLVSLRQSSDRFTEDATAKPQSRSKGGIVTITQELSARTEICALFGGSQMSKT